MISSILRNIRAILAVYFSRNLLVSIAEIKRIAKAKTLLGTVGERVADFKLPTSAYRPHNGSVVRVAGGWVVAVRAINYSVSWLMNRLIVQGGPYNVESQTWIFELNDDFQVTRNFELNDKPYREPSSIAKNGLEDPRLFEWRGDLWALWSAGQVLTNDWENVHNTMALGAIRGTEIEEFTPLLSPRNAQREKNWMPWRIGDELRIIYSISNMEVYGLEDGTLRLLNKSSSPDPRLRGYSGGSQVIPWGDNWICVVHYAARATRIASAKLVRFFYIHRLVVLTGDYRVKAISREFFLEHRGLEFCAGIATTEDYLVLSYSVNDSTSHLMKISHSSVESLFV